METTKGKIEEQSISESRRVWHRLRKKKIAMLSLCVIVLFVLAALLAYPLSGDSFPDADRVMLELATKPPSYQAKFIELKTDKKTEQSILSKIFLGDKNAATRIPIVDFEASGDSLRYNYFIDDSLFERRTIALNQLSLDSDGQAKIVNQTFVFGTDRFGRDVWSRLLLGTRVSLAVGLIAVLLSISIGLLLGASAGYFGGKIDAIIVWLINVVWSIPTLLLVFAITFILGKGFWQIFIAVGLTMWVGTARLIRGQVMGLKELDYIQAAKTMGFSNARIITKHILPNVIGPTIVLAASNFATAILIEAGLSFLGIGVQPPTSSWGLMIKENYNFIITNRPMLAIVPGIAIMIIVLAFNLLGNGLRDAFDVKERV